MKVIYLAFFISLLCVVSESYGVSTVVFELKNTTDQGTTTAYCKSQPEKISLEKGSTLRIDAHTFDHIHTSRCIIRDSQQTLETPNLKNDGWFMEIKEISKRKSGLWSCDLSFGVDGTDVHPNGSGYTKVECNVTVTVIPEPAFSVLRSKFNAWDIDPIAPVVRIVLTMYCL